MNDISVPSSAGYTSVGKKNGSMISMGRQSSLVSNIINAGSYYKNKKAASSLKVKTPITEK
jgi:hypothetical protein